MSTLSKSFVTITAVEITAIIDSALTKAKKAGADIDVSENRKRIADAAHEIIQSYVPDALIHHPHLAELIKGRSGFQNARKLLKAGEDLRTAITGKLELDLREMGVQNAMASHIASDIAVEIGDRLYKHNSDFRSISEHYL